MKPKVFLDTNILMDLLLERPGFEDAAVILQAGEDGCIELCCSCLTMANLAFILRKNTTPVRLAPTLMQIKSLVSVLPMDAGQLDEACWISGRDFEDILQAACAHAAGCTHIVTRNTADYRFSASADAAVDLSSFPAVCTPGEFLNNKLMCAHWGQDSG